MQDANHTTQMDASDIVNDAPVDSMNDDSDENSGSHRNTSNYSSTATNNTTGISTTANIHPPFAVDEKVFCYDLSAARYYDAVVREQKYDIATHTWTFLIHYAGWNARWDKWVVYSAASGQENPDSIVKDTPEARAKFATTSSSKHSHKRSKSPVPSNDGATILPGSGKRRKRMTTTDRAPVLVYEDFCELPFTLKTVLVDECERISNPQSTCLATVSNNRTRKNQRTRPHRLVHCLPAAVTVRKVLNHFRKKKLKECAKLAAAAANTATLPTDKDAPVESSSPNLTADSVTAFCDGLIQLFQAAVPFCLLYPQERPQYDRLVDKDNLVDVYGCEFLLRLYVRLPALLHPQPSSATATVDTKQQWSPHMVGPLLTDLLVLMQKNRPQLFPSTIAATAVEEEYDSTKQPTTTTANYRTPLPDEYMDWEKHLFLDQKGTEKSTPTSPSVVEMDTR